MKKWIVALLFVMLMACTPAADTSADEVADKMIKEPTEPPVEPVVKEDKSPDPEVGRTPPTRPLPSDREDTATTEVETAPKTEMSPQLKDLLKRADEKIKSVSYLYGGTETSNLFLDTYFIMGDKVKILKYDEDYYVLEDYYDNIYVKEAIGCCEKQSRCVSRNVDNTGTPFDVDVSSLNIPKTPYQWSKEIPGDAQIVGPQTFNERSVTYIKYTQDGQEVQMWVDDTYGVPHKIIVGETRYQFNDMLFNNVKESEMIPPCA